MFRTFGQTLTSTKRFWRASDSFGGQPNDRPFPDKSCRNRSWIQRNRLGSRNRRGQPIQTPCVRCHSTSRERPREPVGRPRAKTLHDHRGTSSESSSCRNTIHRSQSEVNDCLGRSQRRDSLCSRIGKRRCDRLLTCQGQKDNRRSWSGRKGTDCLHGLSPARSSGAPPARCRRCNGDRLNPHPSLPKAEVKNLTLPLILGTQLQDPLTK